MLSITLLVPLFFARDAVSYLLPIPSGRYNVVLTTGALTDYTRMTNTTTSPVPRELMLSVFQPAKCNSTIPVAYMPNNTAEYQGPFFEKNLGFPANILAKLLLEAQMTVCDIDGSYSVLEKAPVLLFSPGFQASRLFYNIIASNIASRGFTVITMDHPGDANIITYPDGHVLYGIELDPNINETAMAQLVTEFAHDRAADASFVVDQLSNVTAMAHLFSAQNSQGYCPDRVAMLGHSLGGAASVLAASKDPRIGGAIDWDGTLYGAPYTSNFSQPVMLVSSPRDPDPTWNATWEQLKGPKLEIKVADTPHYGFISDLRTMFKAVGQDSTPFHELLGTVEPAHLVDILTESTVEWMTGVFDGKFGGPLLEKQGSSKFPEVLFVRSEIF